MSGVRRRYGYGTRPARQNKKNRARREGCGQRGSPAADLARLDEGMKTRTLVLGVAALLVAAGLFAGLRWYPGGAVAQAPRANTPRPVSVEVAVAQKKDVPVRIDALGSVTPIASVAVKARIDSEIVGVHFRDGAMVKQGEILFTLDSRALEAQIKQV